MNFGTPDEILMRSLVEQTLRGVSPVGVWASQIGGVIASIQNPG